MTPPISTMWVLILMVLALGSVVTVVSDESSDLPWRPLSYCRRAKGVFKELNQSPHVVELDEREDGWNIQDALSETTGTRTVPQVFVNGKHIGGSDDTLEAYENGELAKLLGIEAKTEQ